MALSGRYRSLESRFKALRQQFIPKRFSPTGSYSEDVLDKARAFRVLIHAELEQYFEDRALHLADKAFALWRDKGRGSRTITALAINFQMDGSRLPAKLATNTTVSTLVGRAVSQFRYNVQHNHGVKTANLTQLFLPLGVDEAAFDVAWLATLDAFATSRGAAAHSSCITYQIDPQADLNAASLIIQGLKEFDEMLNKIERSIR